VFKNLCLPRSFFLSLSFSLSLPLSLNFFLTLSVSFSFSVDVFSPCSLSLSVSISFFLSLCSLSLSLSLALSLSFSLSSLSLSLSLHGSKRPCSKSTKLFLSISSIRPQNRKNEISEISSRQKCVVQIEISNTRISCTVIGEKRNS